MRKTLLYKRVVTIFFTLLLANFSSAQNIIVKGVVKGNSDPLPSATVSIGNKTILTNNAGEFSISILPGTYKLTITHVGYQKIEQSISVNPGQIQSLDFIMTKNELMGEVVVLGSRSPIQRSNLNSAVPVDALLSKDLLRTGQPGLIQMLSFTVPSLNTSRQNVWEPVTLRGLYPDHVLILMNGIRYHSSAWLNPPVAPLGILGKGSVANDLNSIPFSAIEKIEILRDGASAQYGSDAIAGVLNIQLKKSIGKTSIILHSGQQYKADGENNMFGINRGVAIGKKGFLNFSGDFHYRGPTYRGGQYQGTVYRKYPKNASHDDSIIIKAKDDSMIQARNFSRKTAVSNDGNLRLISSGILINGGYQAANNVNVFWTGAVHYHETFYPGAYRFPKNTNQVITDLYPDGFKVKLYNPNWDVTGIAGARGETNKEWHWELSTAYGSNKVSFEAKNTNNASQFVQGKNAQTEFHCGSLLFKQLTNNISFTRNFVKAFDLLKSLNMSFGAEWRFENYQINKGEKASWENYDTTKKKLGGAQGLPGFDTTNAVNARRNVTGIYVDLESDINDHLLIDIAGRYEYYSNYGGNLAGKLAIRYKLSDKFLLRGSVSNGFHAPTLQQSYFSTTSSGWKDVNGVRFPSVIGTFRNNSDIIRNGFGVSALKPEMALNIGGGFTSLFSHHFNLTVDAYWIQIKDRIVFSGGFGKSNAAVRNILIYYPNIDSVVFISNAISTRTSGVDIILNSNWKIRKSNLHISLAENLNRTHIFGVIQSAANLPVDFLNTNTLFPRGERGKVELGQPRDKIILNINYKTGNWTFIVNNSHFGKTAFINNSDSRRDEFFSSKILTDVNVSYAPKSWLNITLGANNVFDVYPDRLKNSLNTNEGILIYSNEASQFSYNGGYYFLNMAFNF
jgi:iron complex outermembrane receptor protein